MRYRSIGAVKGTLRPQNQDLHDFIAPMERRTRLTKEEITRGCEVRHPQSDQ